MFAAKYCRHYFDMSLQIWSSKDVNSFQGRVDFNEFLQKNGISCVFAVGALVTQRILKGTADGNNNNNNTVKNRTSSRSNFRFSLRVFSPRVFTTEGDKNNNTYLNRYAQ